MKKRLAFTPHPRTVLECDFNTGFRPPEMVKVRPVVVLSPAANNGSTCIVVPLSTVEPLPIRDFHHRLDPMSLPPHLRREQCWVKGDMLTTVSLERLDRYHHRDPGGDRVYSSHQVTMEDWLAIRKCALVGIGMGNFSAPGSHP